MTRRKAAALKPRLTKVSKPRRPPQKGIYESTGSQQFAAGSGDADKVFGLLGSDGAGKGTTIKLFTALLPFKSGEARAAGFSITTQ